MTENDLFFARPGRVGVTGHRLNRMDAAMQHALTRHFTTVFQRVHPSCRLMSCLADGTDIIAAEAWQKERCLDVLLPVPVSVWRGIIAPLVGMERLDAVLARAHVTCLSDLAEPDYVALAKALIERSDRIVAVWDGLPGKPGGTGSVVAQAKEAGRNVLHIALDDLRHGASSINLPR